MNDEVRQATPGRLLHVDELNDACVDQQSMFQRLMDSDGNVLVTEELAVEHPEFEYGWATDRLLSRGARQKCWEKINEATTTHRKLLEAGTITMYEYHKRNEEERARIWARIYIEDADEVAEPVQREAEPVAEPPAPQTLSEAPEA